MRRNHPSTRKAEAVAIGVLLLPITPLPARGVLRKTADFARRSATRQTVQASGIVSRGLNKRRKRLDTSSIVVLFKYGEEHRYSNIRIALVRRAARRVPASRQEGSRGHGGRRDRVGAGHSCHQHVLPPQGVDASRDAQRHAGRSLPALPSQYPSHGGPHCLPDRRVLWRSPRAVRGSAPDHLLSRSLPTLMKTTGGIA